MNLTTRLAQGMLAEGDPYGITVLRYTIPSRHLSPPRGSRDVPPGNILRRHLDLLDRWGFTLITLSDCRLFLKGELHLPRKPVVLTFDGGPPELYRTLLHVFREIGGRAVVFVASGDPSTTHTHTRSTLAACGDHLHALAETGSEIGSLTCTGRPLPSLPAEVVEGELTRSKALIEDLLDMPVHSCAYPHDAVTPAIKRMVIKAGYDFAVGGGASPTVFGTDLYEIGRRPVGITVGPLGLAMQVFGPRERIKRMRLKSLARLGQDTSIRIPGNS